DPMQIELDERVERIRRIQMKGLEDLPFFLVAVFLNVLTRPPLMLAQVLLYGYVVSRLLHFAAYLSARTHDARATLWTIGSLIPSVHDRADTGAGAGVLIRPGAHCAPRARPVKAGRTDRRGGRTPGRWNRTTRAGSCSLQ